jgi:tetratricopeptide (TPR) repeat protein
VTNFFISYTQADRPWAEWIAWILEEAGYKTTIQAWDFRPSGNFVVEMQKAAVGSERTIAVLSPDYLCSLFGMAEWATAFAADPDGSKGRLVPVLVREVDSESLGLLTAIIQIRLVGLGESAAREALLSGLVPGRARPEKVRFPGAHLFPGRAAAPPDPKDAREALAALPLQEVPPPGPLPVGSRMPLAPNPLFVGRDEALKILASQLKAGGTSAVGQVEIAAATGLGGMGKTQLASEFVHRYGRYFAGGVFWMSFADGSTVPVEVAASGQSLGLNSSFDALSLEQQVRLVEEAWQSTLPRLLVFDNCEEEDLLQRWRPRTGGARVLVTSRRPEWDATLNVKTVPINTLPRPASIELLRRFRPDVRGDDPIHDAIADELGDLPLALHLAGSFLQSYRNSPFGAPAAYLKSLRKTDLLAHPSLQGRGAGTSPTKHEAHVGRTFALSLDRLDPASTADALALKLLVRAAWFAPGEPIPRPLLLQSAEIDSSDMAAALDGEDALQRLIDLGLLEVDDRGNPLMHRLVAAWARSVAEADVGRVAVEATMIAEAIRLNEIRSPAPLRAWQAHLRLVTDRASGRQDGMAARLCEEMGLHLWQEGDYAGGRPYLERAVALQGTVSGPEHPATARSLNSLGCLLGAQGDYPAARSAYERSLGIREKALGPEHSDTAQSLNDLGWLLVRQGDPAGARPCFEQALSIREKVLGPDHQDTAQSLNNLGGLLEDQGDLAGARAYYERSLAILKKVLGPDHPNTAFSLSNLGWLLSQQGDLAGASAYYERALAIREKGLGLDHPDTGRSLLGLGVLHLQQRNPAKARGFLERAARILKARLGPNHPDTKNALWRLSQLPGARQMKKRHSKKKR